MPSKDDPRIPPVRLDEKDYAKLDGLARGAGFPISLIVRECIVRYASIVVEELQGGSEPQATMTRNRRRRSKATEKDVSIPAVDAVVEKFELEKLVARRRIAAGDVTLAGEPVVIADQIPRSQFGALKLT